MISPPRSSALRSPMSPVPGEKLASPQRTSRPSGVAYPRFSICCNVSSALPCTPPQRPQYQVERCFLSSLVLLALRGMRNIRWERRRHRQESLRVLVLWRNCSFFG